MDFKTSTTPIVRLSSGSSTMSLANREQFICDHTSPDQWPYVESGSNTADEASRGMNAKEFMQKSQWIKAQISCGRQKITGLNKTRTKMK